ncbi:unnamed protein product, partial [marine sediment metagenome]
QNRAYNTLQNAVISKYPGVNIPFNNSRRYLAYNHQLNCYLYCRNNPLKYIDPDGHRLVMDLVIGTAYFFFYEFCTGFPLTRIALEYWGDVFEDVWQFLQWTDENSDYANFDIWCPNIP